MTLPHLTNLPLNTSVGVILPRETYDDPPFHNELSMSSPNFTFNPEDGYIELSVVLPWIKLKTDKVIRDIAADILSIYWSIQRNVSRLVKTDLPNLMDNLSLDWRANQTQLSCSTVAVYLPNIGYAFFVAAVNNVTKIPESDEVELNVGLKCFFCDLEPKYKAFDKQAVEYSEQQMDPLTNHIFRVKNDKLTYIDTEFSVKIIDFTYGAVTLIRNLILAAVPSEFKLEHGPSDMSIGMQP